jgi:hypothetical protein
LAENMNKVSFHRWLINAEKRKPDDTKEEEEFK